MPGLLILLPGKHETCHCQTWPRCLILECVSAGNARLFGFFPDDVLIGQNRECVRLCGLVELVAKILPS